MSQENLDLPTDVWSCSEEGLGRWKEIRSEVCTRSRGFRTDARQVNK